jgi:hypothetical protein
VVPFDAITQFDAAGNWVQWYFVEPYKSKLEARRLEAVPKEETPAWWVYRNQQPVVIRGADQETRFRSVVDRLAKLGFNSICSLPLSTAHRQLGSLASPATSKTLIPRRINGSCRSLPIRSLLQWTTVAAAIEGSSQLNESRRVQARVA